MPLSVIARAGATMKMYVRVMFSSEGASPIALINAMADLGFHPVMGEYDFFYELDAKPANWKDTLAKLHEQLRGLKVMYSVTTKKQ